jgi:hypothetical protein
MARMCRQCRRANPQEASYCYHDGASLANGPGGAARAGAIDVAARPFTAPFVLPSGRPCHSFNELTQALHDDPDSAHRLLRKGFLESFLGAQGRTDLAAAAHAAARSPDRERALDDFLGRLPGAPLRPARLRVEPTVIELGTVRPGEDRHCELALRNEGARLLWGSASCNGAPWLALGDGPALQRKMFQFTGAAVLPLRVVGRRLGARNRPQEAVIRLESNGGAADVTVRLHAPVRPFAEGVLSGATSPRQLAEKARDAQKEAAVLIASGAVARWYEANGWTYPVAGPTASGPAALQQFFEALGLSRPPCVELGEEVIELLGRPGEKIEYVLAVVSQENRPAVAHGVSDQPWLHVGPTVFRGRSAFLPLTVPAVPVRPGETLQAVVSVTANGNQRFSAAVRLVVAAAGARSQTTPQRGPPRPPSPAAAAAPAAAPPVRPPAMKPPPLPVATLGRSGAPVAVTAAAGLLALILLGVVLRDFLSPDKPGAAGPPPPDPTPRIEVRFHDDRKDDVLEKLWFADGKPSMRFGLVTLHDGKEIGTGAGVKRLTFDPWGRTNNTCLRLDKTDERLFGGEKGTWEDREATSWKEGQDEEHEGVRSVWNCDDKKVRVTQSVELVRGEQSNLLDTCRVRYLVDNRDAKEHEVGLRFLLDTFIGGNDGVPFTIPGDAELCDSLKDLPAQAKDKKIPDFLQALEKPDLAHPGTVAHLRLKLEKLEPPVRVTLGAWPNEKLRVQDRKADGPATLWDVPLLSMKAQDLNDSAITIYWKEGPLAAGGSREVGFEYGLWNVAGDSGRLAATVDGVFRPAGELTVVAYTQAAGENETLTLSLPPGFDIIEGDKTQPVPPPPRDAKSVSRPVTWKVRAGPTGKYEIKVESTTGISQPVPVEIKGEIFG